VAARIGAVGGLIRIHSAPGAGTTVEGSVPLPDGYADTEATNDGGRAPAPPAKSGPASTELLDRVRNAVRVALDVYQGTRHVEPLRALGTRLDGPVRVAVVGPPGAGASTLVEAMRNGPVTSTPWPSLIDAPAVGPVSPRAAGLAADAFVLLLRHRCPDEPSLFSVLHAGSGADRPPPAIGVLARADEALGTALADPAVAESAAAECAARPDVRHLCPVVVPVAALLARAAASPREADYEALAGLCTWSDSELGALTVAADDGSIQEPGPVPAGAALSAGSGSGLTVAPSRPGAGAAPVATVLGPEVTPRQLLDRYGPIGVRLAVELIRSGRAPSAEALAAALLSASGLPRLRGLVDTRFVRRADTLKARSALRALDALIRTDPPPDGGRPLLYLLERIHAGAHEFVEMDLVDELQAGEHSLPEQERRAAERLLGGSGSDPRTRLSLAPDAGSQEVAELAAAQLAHWQRRAAHPGASAEVRAAATVLVRTCERLLTGAR
jgi:hypothetical protein